MTGFQVVNGDVVIENGEIQMVSGAELLRQTVETVLNTNKGEWPFDENEGIRFSNILGKHKQVATAESAKEVVKLTKVITETEYVTQDDPELVDKLARRLDGVT